MKKRSPYLYCIILHLVCFITISYATITSTYTTFTENKYSDEGEKSNYERSANLFEDYHLSGRGDRKNDTSLGRINASAYYSWEGHVDRDKQQPNNETFMPSSSVAVAKNVSDTFDIISDFVQKYAMPIIVTVGLIGNILTLIILSKERYLNLLYDVNLSFKENLKNNYLKRTSTLTANVLNNNDGQSTATFRNNNNNNNHNQGNMLSPDYAPPSFSTSGAATTSGVASAKRKQFLKARLKKKLQTTSRYNKPSYANQFSSTNYFIFSLAVSDLIYNIVLALAWVTETEIYNFLHRNYLCQISVMLTYICSFLSAAFTTLFTFQRFMAIVNPLRSATSFSLQSTRVIRRVVLGLFVISCLLYSFSLFMFDSEPKKQHNESVVKNRCGVKREFFIKRLIFDISIDCLLTLIVPSIGILVMNFAICKSLANYRKTNIFTNGSAYSLAKTAATILHTNDEMSEINERMRKSQSPSSLAESIAVYERTNDGKNAIKLKSLRSSDKTSMSGGENDSLTKRSCSTRTNPSQRDKTNLSNSTRITKTLVIVSFCFILLNSPYRTYQVITAIHSIKNQKHVFTTFDYKMSEVLINLYFASYSVNFFLYSLCGKKFRDSLKSLVFYLVFIVYLRTLQLYKFIFRRK